MNKNAGTFEPQPYQAHQPYQAPNMAMMPAPQGQGVGMWGPGHTVGVPNAPLGTIRSTGVSILLFFVTFGIYGLVWTYATHKEMKRHTGSGMGGGLAVLLSFIPVVMWFLTPSEVGGLYNRRNMRPMVSGATGFWAFLPFIGSIVWFVKVNGALNDYWRALGAQG